MIDIQNKFQNNTIIGDTNQYRGSIKFHSDNNTVVLPRRTFSSSKFDIEFFDDGGIVDISGLNRAGQLRCTSKNGGRIKIGNPKRASVTIEQCYILADHANVTLGEDCMISFNVSFRTTDAHGIYDIGSGERLNPSQDIEVGNHVWISQGCIVSKGSKIESGSVIGAHSFLQGKTYQRNSIYAGTPARLTRQNIIWDRRQATNIYDESADRDPNFQKNMNLLLEGFTSPVEPRKSKLSWLSKFLKP